MSSLDVKFSATDSGFTETVSKVKTSVKSMDDSVAKTSKGVTSSFGDMLKAGAALAVGFGAIKLAANAIAGTMDTFKEALDLGGTMKDLSIRTGETAGNLLLLRRAFDNSGAGADKVGTSINKLQKFMDDAAQGSEKNNTVLARLGLTMADMAGKTPTEQMAMLAEKLNGVSDNGERSALAMSVFGKSGSLLLPLLADFSGELKTAQDQLGNMPGVMDRSAGAFDNISDNINVAKGKFLEFAAGLLESIAPALELATDLLTRFDAAGAGMKLGEILTGASNAMGGFTDALSAIKLGEFGLAFKIAFESIKLQAADSINSIAANVMAAVEAAGAFIMTAFGPGSSIFTMIGGQFDILAAKFTQSMIGGAKAIAEALNIPFTDFDNAFKKAEINITQAQNKISNSTQQIAGDFVLAGQEAGKTFDAALSSSQQLINTSEIEVKLQQYRNELKKLEAEATSEASVAAADKLTHEELSVKIAKDRLTHEERLKELDADIASAKRKGNKEELGELEAMKAFHLELEASKQKGLTLQQGITNAAQAHKNVLDGVAQKAGVVNANMMQIKTIGDLIAKTKIAEPIKTFTERSKAARAEIKALKGFLEGDFSRMNLFDLAKKLGISTTRKSADELLTMIEAKLKKIKDTPIDLVIDKDTPKEGLEAIQKDIEKLKTEKKVTLNADASISKIRTQMSEEIDLSLTSSKGSNYLSTISTAVETIRSLVESLEKKLPMPALGA